MSSHHMIETPEGVRRIHCTGQGVSAQDAATAGITEFEDLGFCGTDVRTPCWACVDEAIEWRAQDQRLRELAWSLSSRHRPVKDLGIGFTWSARTLQVQAYRRRLLAIHRAKRPAMAV